LSLSKKREKKDELSLNSKQVKNMKTQKHENTKLRPKIQSVGSPLVEEITPIKGENKPEGGRQ
jgi:hypothetical protein